MLEKPAIPDQTIIDCLLKEYGLRIQRLEFLPITGDMNTAVYRAEAADGCAYFCKLRFNHFVEAVVALPKFYSDQGLQQMIVPLAARDGRLWAEMGSTCVILYPFIEGQNGYAVELTEPQWREFSTALWRIHTTLPPPEIAGPIRKETYAPYWRDLTTQYLERFRAARFDDPVAAEFAAVLNQRRAEVLDMARRSQKLADTLVARSTEMVLCHSDIHPGNLYIDTKGSLFIVDWDYPTIAPKERDLMFIAGGHGFINRTAEEEEALFYRDYDPSTVNLTAMAYYRCEQILIEIGVQCPRVLPDGTDGGASGKDLEQALQILKWLFLPGGTFEMTLQTAQKADLE